MKRFITLFLTVMMISGILVSCGDKNPNNDGGTENPATVATQDSDSPEVAGSTTEPRLEPDLPESDFGGYEFTFLTHLYEGDDWVNPTPLELVAEEENGEPVNDAVYKRNLLIKEKYNINIKMVPNSDEKTAMNKAVKAGDSIYDAVLMFNNNIQGIVTGDLLTNVSKLPYIDLNKPWWDPAVTAMSIDNKNYLLGGDLLILDNEATNVIMFNKKLMSDLGIELPYGSVKNGTWTMDKLNEIISGASEDLNGDGVMTPEDRWGYVTFNDTLHAMLIAGGGALALKDENDIPYMDFTSQRNLSVIEKVMDIMYNKQNVLNIQADVTPSDKWTATFRSAFEEDRALFMWVRTRTVEMFRGMESEFGIVPLPKYDETQEKYYSVVNTYTGALIGVPKGAEDLERISIILEAICAESRYTLQPAYYDVVLQRKYARDEESEEMLDIIFNSRVYDVGALYSFGSVFTDFISLCNKSDRNVVSYYDKKIGAMNKAIEKVVDIFESMD